jgi:hypothetical protein
MVSVAETLGPRPEAVMVTGVELLTAVVVMMKVWLLIPGPNVTVLGTLTTDGLLLLRITPTPAQGAPRVKVTVPVAVVPPVTEMGLRVKVLTNVLPPGASTCRVVRVVPFSEAVTTTWSWLQGEPMEAVKLADVLPAGTVTEAGTVT